ncbi:MAG: hypothetical protein AB8G16_14835 [Gammaproteobacteria bacterium]
MHAYSLRTTPWTRLLATTILALSPLAHAAVPDGINYQAYLTSADGSPVDALTTVTFAVYNVDVGGVPLWNQTESINVDQGLFTVTLGNPVNPFPAGLFDGPVYIGLFVAGEELLPRRAFSSNAYAFKASDADTLDGVDAADLDQSEAVTSLQGDINSTQSDISSVQSDVASNDARISSLEVSGGDITAVGAGAGLTGGGAAGNVSLAIASNAVTSGMIADGNVTASDLAAGAVTSATVADGSLAPADLDSNADYQLGGVEVGSDGFEINSLLDIKINDDINGLRWNSTDGNTPHGNIVVSSTSMSMAHVAGGTQIFSANSNGLGLGGSNPVAGYAVTVPTMRVTNSIDLGLEYVATNYVTNVSIPQCHAHGNLPCFYGVASVSCPAGKKAIGGGSSGGVPRYGAIGYSQPVGNTGWGCSASYDLEGSIRVCTVICANIE